MFFLWVFTICFFWKMIGPDEVQWQRIFGMLVCMDEEVWAPMWFMKVNKRPVSRGFRWVLTFYHVQTAVLFAGKRSKTWHPTCNGGLHGAGGSGQWSQIWSTWRPSSLCVTKLNQIGKARGEGAQQCRMWWGGKCPLLQHQVLPVGNWKVIFWSRGCDTCRSRRDFVPVSKILGIQAASQAQLQATPSGILDPHRTQPTQM